MKSDFLDMLYSRMFFPLIKCPTRITANKAINIFMNYPLVPRGRQQERQKFAYVIMKNNSFARFARAFFIFLNISQTFSFFPRHEMSCFEVVWTTWTFDDKCSILSSYL